MNSPKPPDLIPVEPKPGPAREVPKREWTISLETEDEGSDDAALEDPPSRDAPTRPSAARPLAGKTRSTPSSSMRALARGAALPTSAESKQVRLLPGRRVPGTRYRLVRWLGEGGMGVVYEAEHEDIERRVALKVLRPEASEDPAQAAQFREEARAASRIGSPNIVEIFDFGELPDGRLMFAMELLSGHGLDTELDRCPMDQARMIGILRQVCKGLAAAHSVGIVHRDVKPDNIILITHNGRADWVKVVDFGIATVQSDTNVGAAGTPHYMAPEQVLGHAIDFRLDMYAFGCTAYELLVGKPPFVAPTVEEILEHQLTHTPQPPSERCPAGTVHPALEAVILRCLEKDPTKRYHDMRDVEAALCEAQIAAGFHTPYDDLPLPEVDPDRLERLRRDMPQPGVIVPRRRWLWPAVAALSTLAATALALLIFLRPAPAPEEQDVVDQLANLARAAAGRGQWVYPPPTNLTETSLIKVRTLETFEGPAADYAREKAVELRREFADTLTRLGDQWWEDEGTRPVARDLYVQAYFFDKNNARALERSGTTVGVLADLESRALVGRFSAGELKTSDLVAAIVSEDEAKTEEAFAGLGESASPVLLASAEKVVESKRTSPRRKPAPVPDPFAEVPPPAAQTPANTPGSENPAAKTGSAPVPGGDPGATAKTGSTPGVVAPSRDSKLSQKLVKEARAAFNAGKRKEAESLFHQALAADNRNAAALIGLSDLEFDRNAPQRAADYAEKAVAVAPKVGSYHLKLGDAYYKLLRYGDARNAYLKAKDLGVREADERLAKLKSKLGG